MDTGSKESMNAITYSVKPTIGKLATDPTIERNSAYSILERKKFKVSICVYIYTMITVRRIKNKR